MDKRMTQQMEIMKESMKVKSEVQ